MLVNYSSNANTIRLCGTRCYHSGGIGKQMITSLYRKKIGSTAGSNAGDWVGTEVIDSSGNFYINSSSTNTSFTGDTSSNLTIANSGNINFRANGSSINSMIITSNLIDINERVDIDPPSAGAALTLGRWTGQPNIKANTDDGGYSLRSSLQGGATSSNTNFFTKVIPWTEQAGTDYSGNSLSVYDNVPLSTCKTNCIQTDKCLGFTFTGEPDGNGS